MKNFFVAVLLAGLLLVGGCTGGQGEVMLENSVTPIVTPEDTVAPPTTKVPQPTPLPQPSEEPMEEKARVELDLDHDELPDVLIVYQDADHEIHLQLLMGDGRGFSYPMQCMYFDRYDVADLNGDGIDELLVMGDAGGVGGAGSYDFVILDISADQLELLPLPYRESEYETAFNGWNSGYSFQLRFEKNFKMTIIGEKDEITVDVPKHMKEYLIGRPIYKKNGNLVREQEPEEAWVDGISRYEIIELDDKRTALKIYQYMCYQGHSDHIGDCVSTIAFNGNGFELIKQDFELYAFS